MCSDSVKKKNSKAYEKRYRLKNIRTSALHHQKDEKRFDYFAPEHLVQYQEELYYLNNPVKVTEHLDVLMQRIKRVWKRLVH